MNISLTKELERFIDDLVKSGLYNSSSEVIRAALRLFKEQEESKVNQVQNLRKDIKIGLDQLDRGEGQPLDYETLKKDLQKEWDKRKKAA